MDIAYSQDKKITIKRYPTKYETEILKKFKYQLVDEEIYTSDNQIELNMFYNTQRKQINVISGGLWDFKEGGVYGVDIDLKITHAEKELNEYLCGVIRELCKKYLKPCILYPGKYSINCQIDDCTLTEDIVKKFLEDFVTAIEGKLSEFRVTKKEEKIEEKVEEQIHKIEKNEVCFGCGKDLKSLDIKHWYDKESDKFFTLCSDCWDKRIKNKTPIKKEEEKEVYTGICPVCHQEFKTTAEIIDGYYVFNCNKCNSTLRVKKEILKEPEKVILPKPVQEPILIPRKDKIKKERSFVKTIAILVIMIFLLSIVSVGGYYFLDKNYTELKEEKQNLEINLITIQNQLENKNSELNSSKSELERVKNNFQENSSELQSLKSGDNYNLHDPLYNEVYQFIKDDHSDDEKILIKNAKNYGIRCAYVTVNIVGSVIKLLGETSSGGMYPLVAFNTIDKGMVYFESNTDYRVFPEIGKSYLNCVEGHPYQSGYISLTNYTITNIIVIW